MIQSMNLQNGKRHPWLLTTAETFGVFAVLFASNVAVLVMLLRGAGQNKGALESIARSAESARAHEAEAVQVREAAQGPLEGSPAERPRSSGLQISMPEGWKWRGCRASDSGDSVEILLGR